MMARLPVRSLTCECTWKWHDGKPCVRAPYEPGGGVVSSPALCAPCLFVCAGEQDDELDERFKGENA